MLVKPFQSIGACAACGEPAENGAIAVGIEPDDTEIHHGEWICLACALKPRDPKPAAPRTPEEQT